MLTRSFFGRVFHFFMDSKKTRNSKIIRGLIIAGAVIGVTILLFAGFYKCPMRAFFGMPCPFCGTCRAVLSASRGEFREAFHYHPLWPLILPTFVVEIMNGTGLISLPRKANDIWLIIASILLLVCYIIRICTNTLV